MKEENISRKFKGIWIPKEIWLHPKLSMSEKVVWAEINSLDGDEGCTASNNYLSKMIGLSEIRLTQLITKLKRLGLIQQVGFDGRQRTLISLMKIHGSNSLKSISQNNESPLPIYKEENIDNKKEEAVGKADATAEKETDKYRTRKIQISSVEPIPIRAPRKKVEKFNKAIYDAYKRIHPSISKGLDKFIPEAIKEFEVYFKGNGEAKLIEALIKYSEDIWVKDNRYINPHWFLPKNLLTAEKLEAKLLPLVINPPKDEHLSETPLSKEELREAEETTSRALKEALAPDRGK